MRSAVPLVCAAAAVAMLCAACTNVLVTPGASADGSSMLAYTADAPFLAGDVVHSPRGRWPPNSTLVVYNWEAGTPCGTIPQVPVTYNVVGNVNEYQVSITETTFGGLEQLASQPGATADWGTLMYVTLERSRTAREAIDVMSGLVRDHGYAYVGESFSIADPHEVWILELIGKGSFEKGAVWVAVRVPDGYISSHANQARITTFPRNDPDRARFSPDVVSFAKAHGFYPESAPDDLFSFSDVYNPVTYHTARACEARVWSVFRRLGEPGAVDEFLDYARGANLTHRLPLWIKPRANITLAEMLDVLRDHYEGTPLDTRTDVGSGAFGLPNRWASRFQHAGRTYQHERPISVPMTAFAIVTQMRSWLPREIGAVAWFGTDDAACTVHVPIYASVNRVAKSYVGKYGVGNDLLQMDMNRAYWAFSLVSNFAYSRWSVVYPEVRARMASLEQRYLNEVAGVEEKAMGLYRSCSPEKAVKYLTSYSERTANSLTREWLSFFMHLFAKYQDGYVKVAQGPGLKPVSKSAGYPEAWLGRIVADTGDRYLVPVSAPDSRRTRTPSQID
eukprot:m51a1_g7067 hypothetical protein (562) ;mRNA; r:190224-192334